MVSLDSGAASNSGVSAAMDVYSEPSEARVMDEVQWAVIAVPILIAVGIMAVGMLIYHLLDPSS